VGDVSTTVWNSRVIESELLEALEELLHVVDNCIPLVGLTHDEHIMTEDARSLIAKAKGES
jgi:hypothetical protein